MFENKLGAWYTGANHGFFMSEQSEHPLSEAGVSTRITSPCVLIIFGATGDLTARKLMPAIYNLVREGQLPAQFACVAFARRDKTHEMFRTEMKEKIEQFSRIKPIDEAIWNTFKEQIFYHKSEFQDDDGYERLKTFLNELDAKLGTKGNRIYYLSTQPTFFPGICEKLHSHGLIYDEETVKNRWSRVIIEKPFGRDLNTATALQKELTRFLSEKQIYRIDHYLGKETVQNILIFRFANSIFENLWNNRYIDHVQITTAEDIGIGTRGRFFEEEGLFRDIVQNHMMQLLSLMAMDPPVDLSADAIHNEKVKVLEAIHFNTDKPFEESCVRGQYDKGYVGGKAVNGYREEDNVSPDSHLETYACMRLFIDNWRWDDVPFYLRAGKRLAKKATEIAITFKRPPDVLFQTRHKHNDPNVLTLRIQPDEGISLKTNCKVPGPSAPIQPVKMDFRYGSYFGMSAPEAYERLLCDCILGDRTLFAREDEVFTSWKLFTPLLEHWEETPPKGFPNYAAGSWGPAEADALIEKDNRRWRLL